MNGETEETFLRYASSMIALAAVLTVSFAVGAGQWTAAVGATVPAILAVLATCYLWHRRLEHLTNERTIAAAQPKEYNAAEGRAFVGPQTQTQT